MTTAYKRIRIFFSQGNTTLVIFKTNSIIRNQSECILDANHSGSPCNKDIHSPLEMYSPQPTEYTIKKKGKHIIKHEQFEHFGKTTK